MSKSKEELGEELCNYCPLEDSLKGATNNGNGPSFCFEGGPCDEAYENYLESIERRVMSKKQIDKEIRKIVQKCLDLKSKGINIDFHFSASTESIEIFKFNNFTVELNRRCCIDPCSILFDEEDFKIINDTLDEQFRKVENK